MQLPCLSRNGLIYSPAWMYPLFLIAGLYLVNFATIVSQKELRKMDKSCKRDDVLKDAICFERVIRLGLGLLKKDSQWVRPRSTWSCATLAALRITHSPAPVTLIEILENGLLYNNTFIGNSELKFLYINYGKKIISIKSYQTYVVQKVHNVILTPLTFRNGP